MKVFSRNTFNRKKWVNNKFPTIPFLEGFLPHLTSSPPHILRHAVLLPLWHLGDVMTCIQAVRSSKPSQTCGVAAPWDRIDKQLILSQWYHNRHVLCFYHIEWQLTFKREHTIWDIKLIFDQTLDILQLVLTYEVTAWKNPNPGAERYRHKPLTKIDSVFELTAIRHNKTLLWKVLLQTFLI